MAKVLAQWQRCWHNGKGAGTMENIPSVPGKVTVTDYLLLQCDLQTIRIGYENCSDCGQYYKMNHW